MLLYVMFFFPLCSTVIVVSLSPIQCTYEKKLYCYILLGLWSVLVDNGCLS